VIFLFSAVLMLITLVHFLLGVVAERAVCEPLQSPNNNQLLTLVDKMVRLDKFFDSEVEINVSSIIRYVIGLFFFLGEHMWLGLSTSDKMWVYYKLYLPPCTHARARKACYSALILNCLAVRDRTARY
jgi:hypothetical protein